MRFISLTNPSPVFENFFADSLPCSFNPAVEVNESENDVVVRAELPGVDPAKVEVSVLGDVLTLSGEKTAGVERCKGTFERHVQLPCEIDGDKTVAQAAHGVLTITLDKRAEHKVRKINIDIQ